jgi:hypothetical protein
VEGRIQRQFWRARSDLDVRKLAALEALSRYGKAQGRMLGSVSATRQGISKLHRENQMWELAPLVRPAGQERCGAAWALIKS